MSVAAILLMGGEGKRFGSSLPKQFHLLSGKAVFYYALETIKNSNLFDEILLVCHPDWIDVATRSGVRVVAGGETRQESSWLGIQALTCNPKIILIHDAVRPFVSERILRENISTAREYGAADTCIASADTLVHAPEKRVITDIPKREDYLRGQTPQTFRSDWIREAHQAKKLQNASDDCGLVLALNKPVSVVLGEEINFKITSEFDLQIAEFFCQKKSIENTISPL